MDRACLGFVGAGQMATALARGLVQAGRATGPDIVFHDPGSAARQAFQLAIPEARSADTNAQLADQADVIVLAVKPQHAADAARELAGRVEKKLVVSVVAGIELAWLADHLGSERVVRVMPNTPCLVRKGASGIALGPGATSEDERFVVAMMESVGIAKVLPENLLDAVTGLSGSGPAFVALVIEGLADGGVRAGLPRALALEMAAQTVAGTAELVLSEGRHPGVLKDQVASPGGTTITGLHVLETAAVRGAMISAVLAATERAAELARISRAGRAPDAPKRD